MIDQELLYALIISSISGDITDEDYASLNKILMESEAARKLYDDMYKVLTSEAAIKAIAELPDEPIIPAPREEPVVKIRPYKYYRVGLSIAAAIAFIILGSYKSTWWRSNNKHEKLSLNMKEVQLSFNNGNSVVLKHTDTMVLVEGFRLTVYNKILNYAIETQLYNKGVGTLTVPAGKYYDFVLPDGTKVYASAATTIRFPFAFSGSSRDVWIDGQALFEVTKNDEKPFLVHLNQSVVKVLGTTFNVNSNNKKETISLVEGRVKVIRGMDSIILKPATEVVIQPDSSLKASRISTENILGQKNGIITYKNIKLDELAEYIYRYFSVEVKLKHPVGKKKFYGAIHQRKPVREFMDRLVENNKGMTYSIQNDIIYINNQPDK